jgi:predicted NUDIX family phosphoesterase
MRDFNEILTEWRNTEMFSKRWEELIEEKASALEAMKPSTKEEIMYYFNHHLGEIPIGFSSASTLPKVKYDFDKRSYFEYNDEITRHPIPYCIVRYKNKFYLALRENGSEARLNGKIGMLGGHVGREGIEKGMFRELEEEAGVTKAIVSSKKIRGYIKLDTTEVDKDHLGIVYEIVLKSDKVNMSEGDVLKGIWMTKDELASNYERLENWAKVVYDNLILGGK